VRKIYRPKFALALGAAGVLCAAFVPRTGAPPASGGGDFIVRCFFNGNVAEMDPILDPGSTTTAHQHIFFGNMIQGTASFPTIKSGDGGATGTMEHNGLSTPTNCQDTMDTAGYWQPEPYLNGSPWLPGGGCSTNCSASTDLHLRVYYLPDAPGTQQEIPDGSIMVAGYPDGCHQNSGLQAPPGCNGTTYPVDLGIVHYTCGADNKVGVATPASAWPYNCTLYRDADDGFDDGIVAFTDFPDCWNGHRDWSPPNNASGAKVPGYVAPWISDPSAPVDASGNRLNDFAYQVSGGACPSNFPISVVQLEQRMHLLTMGAGFGEPSTCSAEGKNWNSATDNAELTDSDGEGPPDTDTHTCAFASTPSPNINLSFSCTHGGDPNCTVDTGQKGCGSATGHCFIGANPVGWEALHADYWQTWQEGGGTDTFPESSQGSFPDLVEDCSNEGSGACSFIISSTKQPSPRVFGNPEST
jgi:hypothetical protein